MTTEIFVQTPKTTCSGRLKLAMLLAALAFWPAGIASAQNGTTQAASADNIERATAAQMEARIEGMEQRIRQLEQRIAELEANEQAAAELRQSASSRHSAYIDAQSGVQTSTALSAAQSPSIQALMIASSRPLSIVPPSTTPPSSTSPPPSATAQLDAPRQGAPASSSVIAGAGPDGFNLRSADGNFRLNLRFQTSIDGRFAVARTGESDPNTFYLRRAQPILDGTLFKDFSFRILTDFGQGRARALDTYITANLGPALHVQAGKFKGPVGLERLMSGMVLPLIERGLPTQLVPNRDLGIELFGDAGNGALSYTLGFFDGAVDAGIEDADSDDGKEVEARIFTQPLQASSHPYLKSLGIGIAGTYGNKEGTAGATGLPEFETSGKRRIFSYRAGTLADGIQWRLVPQGYYYAGPFGALWEFVRSTQEVRSQAPLSTLSKIGNTAWQISASYVLTGERNSFGGVTPARSFEPGANGSWGAWQIAARYSELRIDDDAFPVFADPLTSASTTREWAVGLNWYVNRAVRLMFNYDQSSFLNTAGAKIAGDEKAFLQRLQLRF